MSGNLLSKEITVKIRVQNFKIYLSIPDPLKIVVDSKTKIINNFIKEIDNISFLTEKLI